MAHVGFFRIRVWEWQQSGALLRFKIHLGEDRVQDQSPDPSRYNPETSAVLD